MLLLKAFITSRNGVGKILSRGYEMLVKDGELSLVLVRCVTVVYNGSPFSRRCIFLLHVSYVPSRLESTNSTTYDVSVISMANILIVTIAPVRLISVGMQIPNSSYWSVHLIGRAAYCFLCVSFRFLEWRSITDVVLLSFIRFPDTKGHIALFRAFSVQGFSWG